MKAYTYFLLTGISIALLGSCRNEISENKVRRTAERSNEINHKYVEEQREMYVKRLEKRIAALEKDLEKIRSVSEEGRKGAGENIETSVQGLAAEKALLEGSLRMLHEKSEQMEKHMDIHYARYNFALDSMLQDMNSFLASYKTDPGNE